MTSSTEIARSHVGIILQNKALTDVADKSSGGGGTFNRLGDGESRRQARSWSKRGDSQVPEGTG